MEEFDACVQMITRLKELNQIAVAILLDERYGGVQKVDDCVSLQCSACSVSQRHCPGSMKCRRPWNGVAPPSSSLLRITCPIHGRC